MLWVRKVKSKALLVFGVGFSREDWDIVLKL
jgi:hypothetical protein